MGEVKRYTSSRSKSLHPTKGRHEPREHRRERTIRHRTDPAKQEAPSITSHAEREKKKRKMQKVSKKKNGGNGGHNHRELFGKHIGAGDKRLGKGGNMVSCYTNRAFLRQKTTWAFFFSGTLFLFRFFRLNIWGWQV